MLFASIVRLSQVHHAINEYPVRFDVQRSRRPVYYIRLCSPSKVTSPQDAHKRLVLQVYLDSNTLEFSAIRR